VGLITWFRERPLARATALVFTFAGIGYGVASLTSGTTHDALIVASTGLLFTAFLGGVVKLLIDDHQRGRENRAEQARFLAGMLNDLKSVYDRVERARIVIVAHQSARTYGNEMRDLIDAAVKLRNVVRALDTTTSGISDDNTSELHANVESMEGYLNRLVKEFKESYKTISDKQRTFESTFDRLLAERELTDPPPPSPDNAPWAAIENLKNLEEFRSDEATRYNAEFVAALDSASAILRSEVVRINPS
jgi:gas vesicle protein